MSKSSEGTITPLVYKTGSKQGKRKYNKDKKPGWQVQLSLGKDPRTRRYERVSRDVYGTKADAQKVLRQLIKERDEGLKVKKSQREGFESFAMSWHESRVSSGLLAKSTAVRERGIINILCRYLGDVKLMDIDAMLIEKTYADIRRDKAEEFGKPYSESTMNKIHVKLGQIMQKAEDYDLIQKNPCRKVTAPKNADPDRKSLSKKEASRLLQAVCNEESGALEALDEKRAANADKKALGAVSEFGGLSNLANIEAVRLALATGARRGEIFGLDWGSVSLVASQDGTVSGSISISKSLDVYGNLKATKTKAGIRRLFIDSITAESLLRLKNEQAAYFKEIGIKQTNETFVFCNDLGGAMDLHNFSRWFRSFCVRNSFGEYGEIATGRDGRRVGKKYRGLKFHELRHSQATLLLANGIDVKTVQNRLGHANAAITLNWYAHALPENDQRAANLIGDLFASGSGEEASNVAQFEVKTA